MTDFDDRLSIGHRPWWQQMFYAIQISTPEWLSRAGRVYAIASAILLPIVLLVR